MQRTALRFKKVLGDHKLANLMRKVGVWRRIAWESRWMADVNSAFLLALRLATRLLETKGSELR